MLINLINIILYNLCVQCLILYIMHVGSGSANLEFGITTLEPLWFAHMELNYHKLI